MRISDWSSDVCSSDLPGALLGLSGGIDSALVAAIAADALGAERVWGVSLPSRYTADMSNDDAKLEAEALGIRYSVLPIEAAFETFSATLAPIFAGRAPDLTAETIQSRSRGARGRASCRDRECPDVYIPVVAGSVKKKGNH